MHCIVYTVVSNRINEDRVAKQYMCAIPLTYIYGAAICCIPPAILTGLKHCERSRMIVKTGSHLIYQLPISAAEHKEYTRISVV